MSYKIVKPLSKGSQGRRGRKPKPSEHPLGRLIRQARQSEGWTVKDLAEQLGLGAKSVALITLMESGDRPPRMDVARELADALKFNEEIRERLLDWSMTRHEPRSPEEVKEAREQLKRQLLSSPTVEYGTRPSPTKMRERPCHADDIPVFEAGVDPDDGSASPVGFLCWDEVKSNDPQAARQQLIRPVAYRVDRVDLQRLSKVNFPPGYAIVSREPVTRLNPREPYAVRMEGKVVLAYAAWDGSELALSPAAGKSGFDLVSARDLDELRRVVVGQVKIGILNDSRRGTPHVGERREAAPPERTSSSAAAPAPEERKRHRPGD